jgi:hypothetical protein
MRSGLRILIVLKSGGAVAGQSNGTVDLLSYCYLTGHCVSIVSARVANYHIRISIGLSLTDFKGPWSCCPNGQESVEWSN